MKTMVNLVMVIFLMMILTASLYAQVGIGPASFTPNASAGLHVKFTDKGVLIPRVDLATALLIIADSAEGLLVYNTNPLYGLGAGFYYNTSHTTTPGWLMIGNTCGSGTANQVAFWTSGTTLSSSPGLFWNSSNSRLGIGTSSPGSRLTVSNGTVSTFAVEAPAGMTGSMNTLAGSGAGTSLSTGDTNSLYGYHAGDSLSTGNFNILVGYKAGDYGTALTSGRNNVIIGNKANAGSSDRSNVILLGNGTQATANNQVRLGDNSMSSLYCMGATSYSYNPANMYVDPVTGQISRSTMSMPTGSGVAGKVAFWCLDGKVLCYNDKFNWDPQNERLGIGTTNPGSIFTVAHGATCFAVEAPQFLTGANNTIAGTGAGYNLTSGTSNTFYGYEAGYNTWTGNYNVAVGSLSLHENNYGMNNTAVGYHALYNNYGSNNCVAVGYNALYTMDDLQSDNNLDNVAVGNEALYSSIPTTGLNGRYNVALGHQAGYSVSNGFANTLIGYKAGYYGTALTTGYNNVIIGDSANAGSASRVNSIVMGSAAQATADNQVRLGNSRIQSIYCQGAYASTSSSAANMVVGSSGQIMRSTASMVTGSGSAGKVAYWDGTSNLNYNTNFHWDNANARLGIGTSSPGSKLTVSNGTVTTFAVESPAGVYGTNNTVAGVGAGISFGSGYSNALFGYYAGYSLTSGYTNTMIGYRAGYTGTALTTGYNNIIIGNDAGVNASNRVNTVVIGSSAQATADNQVRLGNASSASLFCLGAYAATSANAANLAVDANGQITRSTLSIVTGSGVANKLAFWSGTGTLSSNTNLHWDNTNSILGIGTSSPSSSTRLHVAASTFYSGYFTSTGSGGHVVHGEYTGSSSDAYGIYGKSVPADYYGIGGYFTGGYMGVQASISPIGSNSYYGVYSDVDGGSGTNYAIYGYVNGTGTNYAGYFSGNVSVTGTLSKGAGAFKIDHPLDPENKYLYHSFVESPDMKNIYDGVMILDATGSGTVDLPSWFEALNRDFRYQLTAMGAPGPNLYISEEIKDNAFKIAGGQPGSKVSWQVTGIRKDPFAEKNRIPVEVDKPAGERGKYLYPVAYGLPEEKGIEYAHKQKMAEKGKK